MKTVTVRVDDETCRPCRIGAAEAGMSVPAPVRGFPAGPAGDRDSRTRFDRPRHQRDEVPGAIRARGAVPG